MESARAGVKSWVGISTLNEPVLSRRLEMEPEVDAAATFGRLVELSLLALRSAILSRSDSGTFFMFSTLLLDLRDLCL